MVNSRSFTVIHGDTSAAPLYIIYVSPPLFHFFSSFFQKNRFLFCRFQKSSYLCSRKTKIIHRFSHERVTFEFFWKKFKKIWWFKNCALTLHHFRLTKICFEWAIFLTPILKQIFVGNSILEMLTITWEKEQQVTEVRQVRNRECKSPVKSWFLKTNRQ